jgi:hypothetical protein
MIQETIGNERRQIFNSLAELYDFVEGHSSLSKFSHDTKFAGVPNGCTAKDCRYTIPNVTEKLAKLLAKFKVPRAKGKWNEVDGLRFSPERFIDQRPYLKKRIRVLKNRRYRIVVNVSENCMTGADEMFFKAFAAAACAQKVQEAGGTVEITAVTYCKDAFTSGAKNNYLSVKLLRAGERVNPAAVVAGISPMLLRIYHFTLVEKLFTDNAWGKGRAEPIKGRVDIAGDVVIDRGECLSQQAAETFIDKMRIRR